MSETRDKGEAPEELFCRSCPEKSFMPATHIAYPPTIDESEIKWPCCQEHTTMALIAGWKPQPIKKPPSLQEINEGLLAALKICESHMAVATSGIEINKDHPIFIARAAIAKATGGA